MSVQHLCVVRAVVGEMILGVPLVGRWTGDAPRDVVFMFASGAVTTPSALALYVVR